MADETETTSSLSNPNTNNQQEDVDNNNNNNKKQHERRSCLVCYSDLRYSKNSSKSGIKTTTAAGILPCNHNDICGLCHLRLRFLHNDKNCPICKNNNEQIIVDFISNNKETSSKQFDEYPIWGNELGDDFLYRSDVGMFFPKQYYYNNIEYLFGYQCNVQGCDYRAEDDDNKKNIKSDNDNNNKEESKDENDNNNNNNSKKNPTLRLLQNHLRVEHRLTLCNLCIDNRRDFVARLPRYSPSGLTKHMTHNTVGHPLCEFCKPTRFYDITALHTHLNKEHYKCHVCENMNIHNQFFKNYRSLERHFDTQHYLCHDVQCLTARFVVFKSELDLRHHERQVHGGTSTGDTKIQLEFRVAGRSTHNVNQEIQNVPSDEDFNYNLDGQAFVPAALPTSNNRDSDEIHPQHLQRTEELRQQAAMIRQTNDIEGGEEAFPALQQQQEQDSGQQRLTVGWAADSTLQRVGRKKEAGAVTEEDFPSLAGPAKPKSNATAKIKKGTSAMPLSASWGTGPGSAAAAAAARPAATTTTQSFLKSGPSRAAVSNKQANLSADNFPSLGPGSSAGRKIMTTGIKTGKTSTTPVYAAAEAFAKKNREAAAKQSNTITGNDFPSLGGATKKYPAAENYAKNNNNIKASAQAPPVLDSIADFPAPPTSQTKNSSSSNTSFPAALGKKTTTKYSAAEEFARRNAQNQAAAQLNSNFPTPHVSNRNVTVDDMKLALGGPAYKQLKSFTRDFAKRELAPDAYIDHAASLFPGGYADPMFWAFLPNLVSSCPNHIDNQAASRYMENLKKMRNGALNAEAMNNQSKAAAAAAESKAANSTTWSASSTVKAAPPPISHAPQPAGRYVPPPQPSAYPRPVQTGPKKAAAWGTGTSATTVLRAKAKPGSVTAASAAVGTGPNRASATKYMAKEAKDENWQKQGNNNTSKKKKNNTQKNELRSLAFGK